MDNTTFHHILLCVGNNIHKPLSDRFSMNVAPSRINILNDELTMVLWDPTVEIDDIKVRLTITCRKFPDGTVAPTEAMITNVAENPHRHLLTIVGGAETLTTEDICSVFSKWSDIEHKLKAKIKADDDIVEAIG